MPEERGRIALGFDFGLKRIGIASGDTISATAAPCATVRMGPGGPDWPAIDQILSRFQPDVLIVGAPCHADGTESSLTAAADRFAAALRARCGLAVLRADEFASSIEAQAALRSLRASGARRRRVQRADIDAAAAAIILGRWLAAQAKGGLDGST
ncbi:MAG TPA: Holliday junction resolvase RuvX [Steroidobacteraceae bacterium]|jgi:putative Holliday junction resolvase|nr:Holliday junction resolvase RuvX [Steroidobacteraceae bacterium]